MEDEFMDTAEAICGVIHAALDLVPDDAVAEYPALVVREFKCYAPRNTDETLVLISVAYVQPKRALRLEHTLQFKKNFREMVHELTIVRLKTDSPIFVFALSPIRRGSHCE